MSIDQTGAKLFAASLVKQGVKTIFGIPGAKIDPLFDALIDTPIRMIHCRHEQNAVFMAAAMGRLTGEPGVVLVTSGPGVSNLVTGLLTATTEGDPVVAIGGNVPRTMRLKESHQSSDNVLITKAATKKSVEVSLAENIPEVIDNAFRIARAPRSGATFISVPQDVLTESVPQAVPFASPKNRMGSGCQTAIEQSVDLIKRAKLPVLLLGLEASRENNTEAIRKFLKKYPLPVVSTYQAAGVISKDLLDCFVGRVGLFKNQPGDKLLDQADLVVTIGFGPVEYDPEIWNAKKNKTIIHLDYQRANIHSVYIPKVEVIGSIALTLDTLANKLPTASKLPQEETIKKLQASLLETIEMGKEQDSFPLHPLRFIHDLSQVMDENTTVISDIGTHYMWLARYLLSHDPHHLLFSNGQQTLGVALPWAMATRLVKKKEKIISVSGDGGFLFSAPEIETAVREKLSFVHFVWVDGAYDMVKQQQLLKYGRDTAVDFGPIDYVLFAKSFGAIGHRLEKADDLLPILKDSLDAKGPVIIEVPIDYSHNRPLFENTRAEGN